jgi:hypothetical protein
MRTCSRLSLLVAASVSTVLGISSQARAADSCQAVFDALVKVATIPSHSYSTSTATKRSKPSEAETIFADGHKYIRARGKWRRIPMTAQDALKQEKEKEDHGKSTCQFLRNEPLNGEPSVLFYLHREYEQAGEKIIEDGQMWISKTTGLPLRVEEDWGNQGIPVNEHRLTRFEYGNVQPPM